MFERLLWLVNFLLNLFSNLSWTGLFEDQESGIYTYYWSVGSAQRFSDVMPYRQSDMECATSPDNDPLNLKEGHTYFINVKVNIQMKQNAIQSTLIMDKTS